MIFSNPAARRFLPSAGNKEEESNIRERERDRSTSHCCIVIPSVVKVFVIVLLVPRCSAFRLASFVDTDTSC